MKKINEQQNLEEVNYQQQPSSKKSVYITLVTLLACLLIIIGCTYAWFTKTITSTNNEITTGKFNIIVSLLDETTGWSVLKDIDERPIFSYDNWKPGDTETKILKIENDGTIPLEWTMTFSTENQMSKLADVIDIYVYKNNNEINYSDEVLKDLNNLTYVGTMTELMNNQNGVAYSRLDKNTTGYVAVVLKMNESAEIEYSGISLGTFNVDVTASQNIDESKYVEEDIRAQYADYENKVNVTTIEEVGSKLDMNKDTVVFTPNGTSDATMINLAYTGETEKDFAIVSAGRNTVYSGDLEVSSHANFKLSDDSTLIIDGITVNGTLKVVPYYKNVIIRNVKAKSIEVNANGNTTIENSVIDGSSNNGIYVVGGADNYNLTILNNTILNSTKNGIQIAGNASGVQYGAGTITVEGNTFENWCMVNDKPRSAFKIWGDNNYAPTDISKTKTLNEAAIALVNAVEANNTFAPASNSNQVKFDFYGYTFDSLE